MTWLWWGVGGLAVGLVVLALGVRRRRGRVFVETTGPMRPARLYLPGHPASVRYMPPEDPASVAFERGALGSEAMRGRMAARDAACWPGSAATRRSWADNTVVPGPVVDGGSGYGGGGCAPSGGDGGGAVGGCE